MTEQDIQAAVVAKTSMLLHAAQLKALLDVENWHVAGSVCAALRQSIRQLELIELQRKQEQP